MSPIKVNIAVQGKNLCLFLESCEARILSTLWAKFEVSGVKVGGKYRYHWLLRVD
jgi:hypothetical protein